MRTKTIHRAGKRVRAFVIAFDEGEDPVRLLASFAERHELGRNTITGAAGGFSSAVLGFVDQQQQKRNRVDEQSEVLSLVGDIAQHDGKPIVHLVAILGLSDGTTRGGRLLEASASPTLEIIVTELPAHLRKTLEGRSILALPAPLDEVPTWLHDLHPARRV